MHLRRLELYDFRSYPELRLVLAPGAQALVGANAQGKTNLLEAVHYLATGASHRVTTDAPLVRTGADRAVIRAVAAETEGRERTVELELRPAGGNRGRVNGQQQPRARDALGHIRSVLFAPEDLVLVRGDPSDRRRFLDELLGQRRPAYLAARAEYERVLRQRNAALKQLRAGGRPGAHGDLHATLAVWTDSLVAAGARILAARIAVVHALAAPAAAAAADLVGADAGVALTYELSTGRAITGRTPSEVPDPGELAEELRTVLDARAEEERERAVTLAGPHRDELGLTVGGLPAKGYASHGEQWTLALALRLASREVLGEVGEEPVVLLDDVFAELDSDRRARLAARCERFEQVLVTAAVEADVPLAGPRYHVEQGGVHGPVGGQASPRSDPGLGEPGLGEPGLGGGAA